MSAWKVGKVLWFDQSAGEGVIVDKKGKSFYVNQASLKNSKASTSKTKPKSVLSDDTEVLFTTYQNSYLVQVDKVKKANT